MVFKAIGLKAVTKEGYVEIEGDQGLSAGGSKKRLGRLGETSSGSGEIPVR